MKRRRLEEDDAQQKAYIDVGEIPTDTAALEKCPLIIHTWCDVFDVKVFEECSSRAHWGARFRLCSRKSDPGTEPETWWASIGCFTAESGHQNFLEAAWLPPIAALVARPLMRLSRGYINCRIMDAASPLCLIPPPRLEAGEMRFPLVLEVFTPEPGQLIQILYIQKVWLNDVQSSQMDIDTSSTAGKVVLSSLTGPEIGTNVYLRDCILSFATPSPGRHRKLICAFPGDSDLLHPLISAEQDPDCDLYVGLAKSMTYAWSSLQGGTQSVSDPLNVVRIYSGLSDDLVDTRPMRLALQTSNETLIREPDESDSEFIIPPVGVSAVQPISINSDDSRPSSQSGLDLIEIVETPPHSRQSSGVIEIRESDSSSDSLCEITQIKKLKDLTGLFAARVAETGWSEVLDLVRPYMNSISIDTMRFENQELFNDQNDEWRAHRKVRLESRDARNLFFNKVLLSRLVQMMLYGHLMNYALKTCDSELSAHDALELLPQKAVPDMSVKEECASKTPAGDRFADAHCKDTKYTTDGNVPNSITSSSAPSFQSAVSRKCVQQSIEYNEIIKPRRDSRSNDPNISTNLAHETPANDAGPVGHTAQNHFDNLFAVDPETTANLFDMSYLADEQLVEEPDSANPLDRKLYSSPDSAIKMEDDVKVTMKVEGHDENMPKGVENDYQDDASLVDVMQPSCDFYKLKQRLYPHQLEAIKWMRRREREGPKFEDGYLVRRWGDNGSTAIPGVLASFYDLAMDIPVPLSKLDCIRGGILGDEMGLGKTIQTIVTCLHDPFTKKHLDATQRDGVQFDSRDMRMGCTLILCPVSVINNWKNAVVDFTHIPESAVCVYHGTGRSKYSKTSLAKMVFVITSYQSIIRAGSATDDHCTELHQIHWRRVILDEGHEIRNPRAKKTKAILRLIYDIGWVVTGTPLQNSMTDIQPLLQFLKVKHITIPDAKTALQHMPTAPTDAPVAAGANYDAINLTPFLRFTFAFRTLILRRTKASLAHQSQSSVPSSRSSADLVKNTDPISGPQYSTSPMVASEISEKRDLSPVLTGLRSNRSLALPPKTIVEFKIQLDSVEREKYVALRCVTKMLAKEAKGQFIMLSTLVNHMRLLTGSELALGPKARKALYEAHKIMGANGGDLRNSITAAQYELVLQSAAVRELARSENLPQETVCPICYDSNVDCVTQCSHPFHRKCIKEWFDLAKDRSCPYCRKKISSAALLDLRDIKEYAGAQREALHSQDMHFDEPVGSSTKVRVVSNKIVSQIQSGHPEGVTPGPVKVVVFSSFVRMLNILDSALKAQGVETIIFTGALTRSKRDKMIRDFQTADKPLVFLASYGAGATGVTLTSANTVWLLDPWWNPFTEDQAIDRIHRISQIRPVTVYRVIVEESIEEGVINCQQRKRAMSARVIGGGRSAAGKDSGNATARDLESLLVDD